MIIKKAKTSLFASKVWFDWHHIQKIISEGDIQVWYGSHVQHWVKVADLTKTW
jgi:hypothetical protein